MSWVIETVPGRLSQFCQCSVKAKKAAKAAGRPVKVWYKGPRVGPIRNPAQCHFLMHPNGRRDQTIDPLWWSNFKRRGKGK